MPEKPSDVLSHNPSPQFTGDVISLPGSTLEVFEITSNEDTSAPPISFATDNPTGLSRLIRDGLEGLEDKESVMFAQKKDEGVPLVLRVVRRVGNGFTVSRITPNPKVVKFDHQESSSLEPPIIAPEEAKTFFNDIGRNSFGSNMEIWRKRNDKLGEKVRELGFTEDAYPLPTFLRDQVLALREAGEDSIDIPRILLFQIGKIDGHSYIDAWAAGYFPASSELSWVGHDFTQEHYFGLLPFGDDAMKFASLYANALKARDSMHAMVYREEDLLNKVSERLSGEARFGHGGLVLDEFSGELSALSSHIDDDIETIRFADQEPSTDLLLEMATVIMESSDHVELFQEYLKNIGSSALSEDGIFSPERFRRDLLANAQKRWEIKPAPSDTVSATSSVEY